MTSHLENIPVHRYIPILSNQHTALTLITEEFFKLSKEHFVVMVFQNVFLFYKKCNACMFYSRYTCCLSYETRQVRDPHCSMRQAGQNMTRPRGSQSLGTVLCGHAPFISFPLLSIHAIFKDKLPNSKRIVPVPKSYTEIDLNFLK